MEARGRGELVSELLAYLPNRPCTEYLSTIFVCSKIDRGSKIKIENKNKLLAESTIGKTRKKKIKIKGKYNQVT